MITIEELDALRRAWHAAQNHYLLLCQQHENRMASAADVKRALNEAKRLEANYNRRVTEYQQQPGANTKTASRN